MADDAMTTGDSGPAAEAAKWGLAVTAVTGYWCPKCGRTQCVVMPSGMWVACASCPWQEALSVNSYPVTPPDHQADGFDYPGLGLDVSWPGMVGAPEHRLKHDGTLDSAGQPAPAGWGLRIRNSWSDSPADDIWAIVRRAFQATNHTP